MSKPDAPTQAAPNAPTQAMNTQPARPAAPLQRSQQATRGPVVADDDEDPEPEADETDRTKATHMLVRSRRAPGFNRAGRRFTPEWEAIPLDAISDEDRKRLEGETMLDHKFVHESQLKRIEVRKRAFLDENATREQLVVVFTEMHERLERAEAKIADLQAQNDQLKKGDRPPRRVEDAPGFPSGSGR